MSRALARSLARRVLRADSTTKGVRGLAWRVVSRVLDGAVPKNGSGNNSSIR